MILFFVYCIAAIIIYMLFYHITKDTMNPFGTSLGLFLFAAGGSCLKLNALQDDLSVGTHIILIVVTLEIVIIGIAFTKGIKEQQPNDYILPTITNNYKMFTSIIIVAVIIGVSIVWIRSGGYIYTSDADAFDMKTASEKALGLSSIAVYILKILPCTVLYVAFNVLFDDKRKHINNIVGIVYCTFAMAFLWLFLVSRGVLLEIIFGLIFLLNVKYRFTLKQTAGVFLLIAVMMAVLMTFRVNTSSVIYKGSSSNIYFNSIYNYFTLNYQVLDKLVRHGSPYTLLSSTWVTISRSLGLYDANNLISYVVGAHNARTFLYSFYHDLGIIGILVYPGIIFSGIGYLYSRARIDKPCYYLYLAVLQKSIIVIFYGNYFFGSFSNDVPYFVTIALLLASYKTIDIYRPNLEL